MNMDKGEQVLWYLVLKPLLSILGLVVLIVITCNDIYVKIKR